MEEVGWKRKEQMEVLTIDWEEMEEELEMVWRRRWNKIDLTKNEDATIQLHHNHITHKPSQK